MKKWLFTIYILTIAALTACQGPKETVVEKHYVSGSGDTLPVPPNNNNAEGGIDGGGGGNGVNRKPLESFRVDLEQVASYQRIKVKVIDKLVVRFPKLAADLLHIAAERSWYLIPTELKNLPASKIGVSFKTDQIALQKLKEIWINDLIFSTMSVEDQDILILHELLMGVRLLEFTNLLDQCLNKISTIKIHPENQDQYKTERSLCFKRYRDASDLGDSIGLGKSIKLEDYDYETIRNTTALLLKKADTFNAQELEDELAARKFRRYNP